MTELARLRRAEFALAAFGLTAFLLTLVFVVDALRFHGDALRASLAGLAHGEVEPSGLLLVALAAFDAVVVARATTALARGAAAQRRLVRRLAPAGARELGGHAVTLVASERPLAFCAGLLRPRIYVSTGAVDCLSADQLQAVVAHEAHHVRRRDPLRLLAMRALGDAFGPLPPLRSLCGRERELADLAADAAAVRRLGGARSLAAALLAFDAGAAGIAPLRVDRLIAAPAVAAVPRPLVLGAGAVICALLAQLVWTLAVPGHPSVCLPLASAPIWTVCALGARVLAMAPAWLGLRRAAAYLQAG